MKLIVPPLNNALRSRFEIPVYCRDFSRTQFNFGLTKSVRNHTRLPDSRDCMNQKEADWSMWRAYTISHAFGFLLSDQEYLFADRSRQWSAGVPDTEAGHPEEELSAWPPSCPRYECRRRSNSAFLIGKPLCRFISKARHILPALERIRLGSISP